MKTKLPPAKKTREIPREQEQPPLVDLALYHVPPPKRRHPKWVMERQIVYGGSNEPLFFIRRLGGFPIELKKDFLYWHSEEFVRRLKAFGFNIVLTSFEKNHVVEEEFLDLKKRLAKYVHKHGLRLAVYIRGDQVYHDFKPDGLALAGHYQRQADGRIPLYGALEYRKYVCMHHPEVRESYKETIRRAIQEIGVDALHFDGNVFGGVESAGACRCERCRADFTDFLVRRYGKNPELAKERFGHAYLDRIEPPGAAYPAVPTGPIIAPDWQEWISFRCTWSTMLMREIGEYIYSLNQEVAVIPNGCWPAVKENIALFFGWDMKTYQGHADLVFIEDGYYPHIEPDGKIIHKVRQMKMVRNEGLHQVSYCVHGSEEREIRMQMAFEAAFNRGRIPIVFWHPDRLKKRLDNGSVAKKDFLKWVNAHWDLYRDLETWAEFTVWRSQRGLAFAAPAAFAAFVQVEQLLTEERLPFEICFDKCLDALAGRRVLIVPDVTCVTTSEGKKIIDFVHQGGGLLTGCDTSLRDGWHRQRRAPLFSLLMENAGPGRPVWHDNKVCYARSGLGKVAVFPSFVKTSAQPPLLTPHGEVDFSLDYTNWRPPENAGEVLRALKWLAGNEIQFSVDAPRGVLAEYYRQPSKNRCMAHLVNLDVNHAARNVAVRLNGRIAKHGQDVKIFSPDSAAPCRFEVASNTRGVTVSLDTLDTYAVVVIPLKS